MTLRDEIMDGQYEYGSLLPSEREVCERFSVERSTVRKALELLVEDGIVAKHPGIGTEVVYFGKDASANFSSQGQAIGFFLPEDEKNHRKITQPFYADLFYHLERACHANNCQVIYSSVRSETNICEIIARYNCISAVFVTHTDRIYINPKLPKY
jgi:DNA-binding transcriptional MocR family regulator